MLVLVKLQANVWLTGLVPKLPKAFLRLPTPSVPELGLLTNTFKLLGDLITEIQRIMNILILIQCLLPEISSAEIALCSFQVHRLTISILKGNKNKFGVVNISLRGQKLNSKALQKKNVAELHIKQFEQWFQS